MRRIQMSAPERRRRSRAAQLVHFRRLLRGTLTLRKVTCGKASCHCSSGDPHLALYLVQSHNGKPRQLFIPKKMEKRVRDAVSDYQQLQGLIEELSEVEWKHVEDREE